MRSLLIEYAVALIIIHSVWSQQCSLDQNGAAEKVSVLVLGGGMAGISAARKLQVSGITSFMIFEGRNRLGGRIKEDPTTGYEVGANWIQGLDPEDRLRHPVWREWIRCDPSGPQGSFTPSVGSAFANDGSPINISVYEDTEGRMGVALENLEERADNIDPDVSVREGLMQEGWNPTNALENVTDWLNLDLCSGIEPEKLSVRLYYEDTYTAFTGSQEGAEAEDYLISDKKGFSYVVNCLAREFTSRVKLNSSVSRIQVADDCVCIALENSDLRYCGDYAIVTFSIGVLQAAIREEDNTVHFEPSLPESKITAINSISLAGYAKVRLTLNSSFWNITDEVQQVAAYASNVRGWYPYILFDTNIPNTILFDISGELAHRVENQPIDTTIEETMNVLRRIYGNGIPDPVNAVVSNWTNDPYIRHAWVGFDVGLPLNITEQLMTPVGRLYFAGEGLNNSFYGYVHGAYGSGAYIANTIIKKIESSAADQSSLSYTVVLQTAIILCWMNN